MFSGTIRVQGGLFFLRTKYLTFLLTSPDPSTPPKALSFSYSSVYLSCLLLHYCNYFQTKLLPVVFSNRINI